MGGGGERRREAERESYRGKVRWGITGIEKVAEGRRLRKSVREVGSGIRGRERNCEK